MKGVSAIKKNQAESPKTPGGISKSLLTPCRRVGLSRTWKKSGSSPFISPLSGSSININIKNDHELRKRKSSDVEKVEQTEIVSQISTNEINPTFCDTPKTDNNRSTSRCLMSRKKFRILSVAAENQPNPENISDLIDENISVSNNKNLHDSIKHDLTISKLSRKKSIHRDKIESSNKVTAESSSCDSNSHGADILENPKENEKNNQNVAIKENSPNKLTKECMVVIQNRILNLAHVNNCTVKTDKNIINKSASLFDSDEDVPLAHLNKKNNLEKNNWEKTKKTLTPEDKPTNNIILDKNVCIGKSPLIEKKLNSETVGVDVKASKNKPPKLQNKQVPKSLAKPNLSNTLLDEEDDDFDYDKMRTIFIKKTYKIAKPIKAKSTGSISQKDIDDIKARIERKNSLLMAKAMSNETQELRDLIKKWQSACQTALMDLLHLMKEKMPDQNMDHSELLDMLKIPPDLVGYDLENDCFNTPDDSNIILSGLKVT